MRMRDRAFVGEVVQLIGKTEMPFFREEAIHLLKRFVELPSDLTRAEDLDASRLASWWKKAGKQLVWDPKKHRFASPGN